MDPGVIPADKLAEVLSDVLFDLAPTHVSPDADGLAAAEVLAAAFAALSKENIHGSLGIDPIGFAALNGTAPDLSVIARAAELTKPFSGVRSIVVDASRYDSVGAGDVAQLAYALATGIEYAYALTDLGLSVDEAFDSILFRVSADTNRFITISRLHALRTLWNRVGEVPRVSPGKCDTVQHAVTSPYEITRDDAYVNMLRDIISAFVVAIDQAELITVLPLDTVIGLPDVLTRRVTRNTQVVLTEESNIGHVNNPTGSAWFTESMTKQLCGEAWELLGQLDEKGMAVTVADDTVAAQLKEINEARAKLLAARKLSLTGASMSPNHLEKALERTPRPAAPKLDDISFVRDNQVFEDLRGRSEATRETPAVLLACLGTWRDFGSREGFTSNLYHADGVNTVIMEDTNPEVFVEAIQETGTDIAVLYSSAKVCAAHSLTVAKALKEAGAQEVRLVGQPKELGGDEAEMNAVIGGSVLDGMNVVELLASTLDRLEA